MNIFPNFSENCKQTFSSNTLQESYVWPWTHGRLELQTTLLQRSRDFVTCNVTQL